MRDSTIKDEAERDVGVLLGSTRLGGTQLWEVLHSQTSIKTEGTGYRWRTEMGKDKKRGL